MKNIFKYIGISILVALVIFAFYILNAFFGNPLSKTLAKFGSDKYIKKHYADMDLEKSDVYYNFKDGYYAVRLQDKNSIDTNFQILFDSFGRFKRDSYSRILFNTWRRFADEISNYGKGIEKKLSSPFEINLRIYDEGYDELVLDQEFKIEEFPFRVEANIYGFSEEPSYEEALQVLKEVKDLLDKEPFETSVYSIVMIPEKNRVNENEAQTWENALIIFNIPPNVVQDGSIEDLKKLNEKMGTETKDRGKI